MDESLTTEQLALATAERRQPRSGGSTSVASLPCLIYSTSIGRRQRLARDAEAVGWSVVVAEDVGQAFDVIAKVRFPFALIDVESVTELELPQAQRLSEELAKQRDSLLAVIGRPDQFHDEIWARQIGVWVYLPGLALELHAAEMICHEAIQFHIEQQAHT